MSHLPRVLSFVVVGVTLVLGACARRAPEQGHYAFTATEVLRDDCGLLPSPAALWDGKIIISGEVVKMRYQIFDEMELDGRFQEVSDAFYVDGSRGGVATNVNGIPCDIDFVKVHIEGQAAEDSLSAMTGSVDVQYDSVSDTRCRCRLQTGFRAERDDVTTPP